MTTTRHHFATKTLALLGLALPYVVAVLSTVLFRETRTMDYYRSGRLAAWDTVTGWLTFSAFVLGSALCCPWLWERLAWSSSRVRWIALGSVVLVVQFIAVFSVRFLVYVSAGGIL